MKQVNKSLFNVDKKGNTIHWSVYTDGYEVVIQRGRVGEGMKVTESRTASFAKQNTTAEEQAAKEAASKWRKQVKKGYVTADQELGTSVTLAPLAKKYQDVKHKATFDGPDGAILLTKYDGVRMTAFYRNGEAFFQSRGGESYPIIEDIADELYKNYWSGNENLVIDGELHNHDMCLEDITSAVKKHNEDTDKLVFMIFDMVDPVDNADMPYLERLLLVGCMMSMWSKIKLASWDYCFSEVNMLDAHDGLVHQGYEGVILRDPEGLFRFNQRDVSFIKYKVRHRAEYATIKPTLCKNGSVKIECKVIVDGEVKTFSPPMLGTIEHQKKVYDNWGEYNTGYGTIEYEKISKYGIPSKSKFISFRELDSEGLPLV